MVSHLWHLPPSQFTSERSPDHRPKDRAHLNVHVEDSEAKNEETTCQRSGDEKAIDTSSFILSRDIANNASTYQEVGDKCLHYTIHTYQVQ
jgi:hypothetical protein